MMRQWDRWLRNTPVLEGAPAHLKRQRLRRSVLWTTVSFAAMQFLRRVDIPASLTELEAPAPSPFHRVQRMVIAGVRRTHVVDLRVAEVQGALAAIVLAPLLWNLLARWEYRARGLSRWMGGDRHRAHACFCGYVLAFSALREYCFSRAVAVTPAWDLSVLTWRTTAERALRALGFALYIAGSAISGAGFWRLGKFTYLPEYFGIFCDEIITSFPFNLFADPMYLGSALMHFGYALMHLAPTGLFLAVILSLAYWIAARLFEEPFMNKLYARERKRRRARALRRADEPETGMRERAGKGASGRAPAARAVGEPARA